MGRKSSNKAVGIKVCHRTVKESVHEYRYGSSGEATGVVQGKVDYYLSKGWEAKEEFGSVVLTKREFGGYREITYSMDEGPDGFPLVISIESQKAVADVEPTADVEPSDQDEDEGDSEQAAPQCSAMTKSGKPCSRKAAAGEVWCSQHLSRSDD